MFVFKSDMTLLKTAHSSQSLHATSSPNELLDKVRKKNNRG